MSQYSKDELVAPAWLDREFYERALRSYKRDATIKVVDFKTTPGTVPGEHFASIMFRVDIDYLSNGRPANIKVILKTVPVTEGFKAEILKNSSAFESEAKMYSVILPEMERVLRVAGDSTVFGPPLVYQNLKSEVAPVIVFEDISPDGFRTYDDAIPDWEQVQLIVRRLAKFHAVSLYVNENGFPLEGFNRHIWVDWLEDDDSFMAKMLKPNFLRMVEAIKDWEGFESYYARLHGNMDRHLFQLVDVLKNPRSYKILNHGDFHAKNMMFRNQGYKEEDVIFIDFQFPFWSSPALDLQYVFNMLVSDLLVEVHREDILRIYYTEFRAVLKKIDFKGTCPTFHELKLSLLQAAALELFYAMMTIPPRLFNWRTEVDIETALEEGEKAWEDMGKKIQAMPEYREYLLKQFKRVELTGILDF